MVEKVVPIVVKRAPVKSHREGRGFSVGEIKAVNLSAAEARRLGLMVDERRKTTHQNNVKVLKEWLDARLTKASPAPKETAKPNA